MAGTADANGTDRLTPAADLLAGLRVLDLTRLLPGPAVTMHLADFGADVIKVEDTGEGDYLRGFPPQVETGTGASAHPAFVALNRGKRSLCLNLKDPAAREALLRLVERSDALVESFRPGVLARLGIGWEVLHARNPRLVLCSISGYGQQGPLAQRAGHDINYIAITGILDQNRAHGRPALPNLQIGDVLGGTLSALSTLTMALLAAQRRGVGHWVDVAMTDGLLAHHVFPHADLDAGQPPVPGATLLTGGVACYGVYETADGGFMAVGALEFKFWAVFCSAIGRPDLREQHWTLGQTPGSAAARQTIAEVATAIAQQTRAHWAACFEALDCCVTPVLSPMEALDHPQTHARGLRHHDAGATWIGPLAAIAGQRPAPASHVPVGLHTRSILREAGLDPAEIAALVECGNARA